VSKAFSTLVSEGLAVTSISFPAGGRAPTTNPDVSAGR
jgi:hypothetical protein